MNENTMNSSQLYKLTLKRENSFVGSLISFKVYIDDVNVAKIKNGQTVVLDVTPGQHIISINKKNPINIVISGDTSADVVIFGSNNFGITNINGSGMNQDYMGNNMNLLLDKYKKQANTYLSLCVILPIISLMIYFFSNKQYILPFWFYSLAVGYGLVNVFGLEKIKISNSDVYKSSLIKNIIGIIIGVISVIVTFWIIDF